MMMKLKELLVISFLIIIWIYFFRYFSVTLLPQYTIGESNIVTKIMWDYRGFDTFGEELVLLSAGLGVFMILRGVKK